MIGASKCAAIAAEALKRVDRPGLDWSDDKRRREALTRFDVGKFDDLDTRFYAYPDPLSSLLYRFVAAHPKDF
jgi:hypothetical protein